MRKAQNLLPGGGSSMGCGLLDSRGARTRPRRQEARAPDRHDARHRGDSPRSRAQRKNRRPAQAGRTPGIFKRRRASAGHPAHRKHTRAHHRSQAGHGARRLVFQRRVPEPPARSRDSSLQILLFQGRCGRFREHRADGPPDRGGRQGAATHQRRERKESAPYARASRKPPSLRAFSRWCGAAG